MAALSASSAAARLLCCVLAANMTVAMSTRLRGAAPTTPEQPVPAPPSVAIGAVPPATPQQPDVLSELAGSSSKEEQKFGQIFADLGEKLHTLRTDDLAHMEKLSFNVELRMALREKLRVVDSQLASKESALAQFDVSTLATVQPSAKESPVGLSEAPANSTGAAGLLQVQNSGGTPSERAVEKLKQVMSQVDMNDVNEYSKKREWTIEQVATNALELVRGLGDDIKLLSEVHDQQELDALRNNAKTRDALGAQLASEQAQLQKDAGSLEVDLKGIHDSVQAADQKATDDQDGHTIILASSASTASTAAASGIDATAKREAPTQEVEG